MVLIIRLSCIVPSQFKALVSKRLKSEIRFDLYAVAKELGKLVSPDTQITRSSRRVLQSGDHGTVAPPVPIPNTEVKRCCADDSMATGHAKVGRRQFITPRTSNHVRGVFFYPSGPKIWHLAHTAPPPTHHSSCPSLLIG